MQIRQILIFLGIILCSLSCKDSKEETPTPPFCNTETPLENIAWLKEIHHAFQVSLSPAGNQIIQYEYKEECVFLIDNCHNCPDGLITVYNEAKEVVCLFGGFAGVDTCPDFQETATNKLILWDNL